MLLLKVTLRMLFIGLLLRKEVIQPQVPLRLPCYDFIPVINRTLGAYLLVKGQNSDFGCSQLP